MAEKHPIEEVDATLFPFLGIFEVGMMTQISRVFDELVTPQWLVDRFTQYIDTYNFAGVMQLRAWSLLSIFVEGCTRELSLKRILVGGQLWDKLGSSVLTVYGPGALHANHPFAAGYDGTNPSVSALNTDHRGLMDVVVHRFQQKAKAETAVSVLHLPANPVAFLRCHALINQAPAQPLWGPTPRLLCDTYTGAVRKRTVALSGHLPGDTFMAFVEIEWNVHMTATVYTTEKRRGGPQDDPESAFPMTVQLVRDALGQQEAHTLLGL
ncbi:unnamed protein product [Vitrella brassicaformis CCMP3155]|uniref:Uncharacterized protein n=1 Tax=Vitrella brassicaformis (strain CCMP3155) TaxID=1169540 RepID=A0A0G4GT33_VITBC|nr:unnamed protein product [Vitrella brassicaformis CCMP3155]|eukprot:CEM33565.1 unnamed protein product [Vitrella brassicaformis CCMP3155]